MSRPKENKLKRLVLKWPRNTIYTSEWMKGQGFSRQLIDKYKKSKWLAPVGKGAYKLFNDTINWTGALYAVQNQLHLSIHPGGKTALQLKGLAHFVPIEIKEIFLFGTKGQKLPSWFKTYDWGLETHYIMTHLFGHDLGLNNEDYGSFSIKISSPERAIMEMLYFVPQKQTLSEGSLIMEHLISLRPPVIQDLLEICNSIKVKRLFMYLAEKHSHRWVERLNLAKVNLGSGKLTITKGGVYDRKYKITVPGI
jgi:hypothetical protein